jgi:3-phenylpropionate/cinnamic acid dioxygenase small subunit
MNAMAKPTVDELLLRFEVEQFLLHEADLLDTRQFEAWLDLLGEDIRYWMPVTRNQAFGNWDGEHTREGRDLNWFDEGKFELEQRVKQIMTGRHWSEEPISRTTHMISNLNVIAQDEANVTTKCRFLVYRNRNEVETDLFVGKRQDDLRRANGSWLITRRQIFLDQTTLQAKNLTLFF